MRVAGIDCGTNSIRLLIADWRDGRLVDVVRELRIVRLGQDVDRTGRLAPEALERTRQALAEYAATIRAHGATRVRMVATSATRDASNRAEFTAMVHAQLGTDPEVITGPEEARLTFTGAVTGLPALRWPALVADIGGGSSELVRGAGAHSEIHAHSMNVGSVRMTERHLHDDPPTSRQVEAVVADVRAALHQAGSEVALDSPATLVGVAGTVTTMAAVQLGLRRYDPDSIHGSVLSAAQVHEVTARLLSMTHDQRAALPVIHPGRIDVITAGALIVRTLVQHTGVAQLIVSEHDILDGIAYSVVR